MAKKQAQFQRQKWLSPRIGLAVALGLVSFLLYFNTLGHDLLFDDVTLILQNPHVVNLDVWGVVFESGYRPVRTLTYLLNYWWGGEDPYSYHLVNVLLHSCNTLLVFFFLWLLFRSRVISGLGTLFFTVHPVQTAAVAYVSGRKDLLATFFVMAGILCFLRARSRGGKRWFSVAFLLFGLAIFSKEVAVVFPAFLLLIDASRKHRRVVDEGREAPNLFSALVGAFKESPYLYAGFSLLTTFGFYWVIAVTPASRMESYWGGTFWTNLGTSFELFAHYFRLAVFPVPLIADYSGRVLDVSTGLLDPSTLLSAALVLLYLSFALWSFRFWPEVSVSMIWFFVAILPVLQIFPFHELAADHFLYLPLVGAALGVGFTLERLASRWGRQLVLGIALLLAVMAGAFVVDRNEEWADKRTLWEATLASAPNSYRANANLGEIYFSEGRRNEGLERTKKSIELAPQEALPRSNLGAMLFTIARDARSEGELDRAKSLMEEATRYLEEAVRMEPDNPFNYANLGNVYKELGLIYEMEGQEERALEARLEAKEIYEKALAIPDARREVQAIWMNYGGLYLDAGYPREAVDPLRKFVAAYPESARGNYWLGVALLRSGSPLEAVPFLEKASELRATVPILTALAEAYEEAGRFAESIELRRRLAEHAPSAQSYYDLGRVLGRAGDRAAALRSLERAGQLSPSPQLAREIEELQEELVRGEQRMGLWEPGWKGKQEGLPPKWRA